MHTRAHAYLSLSGLVLRYSAVIDTHRSRPYPPKVVRCNELAWPGWTHARCAFCCLARVARACACETHGQSAEQKKEINKYVYVTYTHVCMCFIGKTDT